MNSDQQQALAQAALQARERAYAPYSRFTVGAALQTAAGRIFTGANVENASYGLTICAERTVIAAAVTAGERSWKAIAVASRGGVTPCGACRQVLREFAAELKVFLVDSVDGRMRETKLSSLLPDPLVPTALA